MHDKARRPHPGSCLHAQKVAAFLNGFESGCGHRCAIPACAGILFLSSHMPRTARPAGTAVLCGKRLAALGALGSKHFAATHRRHARTETMAAFANQFARLIRTFHGLALLLKAPQAARVFIEPGRISSPPAFVNARFIRKSLTKGLYSPSEPASTQRCSRIG